MSTNYELNSTSVNNIFGVKHYNVKIIKKKENPFKYIVSVLSYALFIFLMLIGGTLLLYIADIKNIILNMHKKMPTISLKAISSALYFHYIY